MPRFSQPSGNFTRQDDIKTGLLSLFSGSRSDFVLADMTDLCTNTEWNGKRQQEDGGDNDVNGALRPSSLREQQAYRWVTHCRPPPVWGEITSLVLEGQKDKPWGRSAATATSLYSALSSAWNVGSQTSWLCAQKSDGWRTWRITVSEGEKTRSCSQRQRDTVRHWKGSQQVAVLHRVVC